MCKRWGAPVFGRAALFKISSAKVYEATDCCFGPFELLLESYRNLVLNSWENSDRIIRWRLMSGLAFFGTRQDDGEDPSRKIETGRDFFSQEEIATRPLFRDSRLEDFESRILLAREPFFLTAINPTKTNTHFTPQLNFIRWPKAEASRWNEQAGHW